MYALVLSHPMGFFHLYVRLVLGTAQGSVLRGGFQQSIHQRALRDAHHRVFPPRSFTVPCGVPLSLEFDTSTGPYIPLA